MKDVQIKDLKPDRDLLLAYLFPCPISQVGERLKMLVQANKEMKRKRYD